jgi:SAM-dependent methyltransferase
MTKLETDHPMSFEKLDQTPATYDNLFVSGGDRGVFDLHYRNSCYFPMFQKVERILRRHGCRSVLEVGCGTGAFAHLLLDKGRYHYRGFDFSSEAVKRARIRTGEPNLFFQADAADPNSYSGSQSYDAIVCTEVLEHVPDDIAVISQWPAGSRIIATVPSFDSAYHLRYFTRVAQVENRYGGSIAIDNISRIKKPFLVDISLRNRLREIRWARYRPALLKKLLGLGRWEDVGYWFVIDGLVPDL